jgi:uncharacterized protein (DUF983 family)
VFTGLSVDVLGNMCLVANGVITLMINARVYKLPEVCPEAWETSRFKVGSPAMMAITIIGTISSILIIILNASTLSPTLLGLNIVVIVCAFIFSFLRSKKTHVEISYEKV